MLTVKRRDTATFTFYFYDENGAAFNLTGYSLFTTVKQSMDDADAAAKISASLTLSATPTDGTATWTITAANTQYLSGVYFWDVQLKDGSGNITTVISDFFEVKPDVTIRITA